MVVSTSGQSPGFMYELCVALAHRWEPERLFMILTAYFDESGTHGEDIALMAGYVADARQWRKFEKRAKKLFTRFRVDVFHSIDLKRTDKDFAGWKVDTKIEFLDEFQHIVNECLEFGVVSILSYENYDYYKKLDWPKGTRKDSLYGLLFRACLAAVIDSTIGIGRLADRKTPPRVNIVLESGCPSADDAMRLYNFFQQRFAEVPDVPNALAGLTFAPKGDSLAIASADLIAYSAYHQETNRKPLGIPKKPIKAEASYTGNLYRVVLGREELDGLFQQAIDIKAENALKRRRPVETQPS